MTKTETPSSGSVLIKKGTTDSLIQVAATALVRLGLVVSIFLLAPFVTLEELGRFDIFVVSSSFVLLGVTLGMDSGLALIANRPGTQLHLSFLLCSIAIVLVMGSLAAVVLLLLSPYLSMAIFPPGYLWATLSYGTANAVILVIFSFYRWLGQARTASVLIIGANAIGFSLAGFFFALSLDTLDFVAGLTLGSMFGCLLCFGYVWCQQKLTLRAVRRAFNVASKIGGTLLALSLPYMVASLSLLMRRFIDRSFILLLGDPTMLGAYALVARFAELVGFTFGLPAMGFAPLFISGHKNVITRQLAQLVYSSYCGLSLMVVLVVGWVQLWVGLFFLPEGVAQTAALLLPILGGTLFLGEISIAGFGFIICRRPRVFTLLSFGFPIAYALLSAAFYYLGFGLLSISLAFVVVSFAYSTLMVVQSEKLCSFNYRLYSIGIVKTLNLAWCLYVSAIV